MKRLRQYLPVLPACCLVILCLLLVTMLGNQAATVLSQSAPIGIRNTVIIDAGHGGVDGGATSCTGILESKINLEIALRLDDLMHLLGIQTKMIRISDCSIYTRGETIAAKKVSDLKERVRIVNDTENSVLISIHQNYFSDSRYFGAQTFYGKAAGSKELAATLQSSLVQTLNQGSRRTAKEADGIYLLENIERCGVLVECGFISNPQEEAKLTNMQYQKRLCCVIASVLSQYFSIS